MPAAVRSVAIVDYGVGNLDSVRRAIEECGGRPMLVDRAEGLRSADRIILPGVGAFASGMANLQERGLDEALREEVLGNGVLFLGLCLGMQLLATSGWEGGTETKGLEWIEGEVRRLAPPGPEVRVPHVGWNEVRFVRPSALFREVPEGRDFYFAHSYHMICANPRDIIAETPYGSPFVSAVAKNNIYGVQFHPEKSQRVGFKVIRNFVEL
jgi:imidazole glycerol-phosphate synthase subunit HisH